MTNDVSRLLADPYETPARDRAATMAALQGHIFSCARCVRAGALEVARPITRGKGSVDARMLVVGQAPGATGHLHDKPFSGMAGRTLNLWFQRAGLPPWAHHDPALAFVTAITRCFPGKANGGRGADGRQTGGKGDRMPSGSEILLCQPYLEAEFALVCPEVVVILGRLAATRLIGPEPLGELIGTVRQVERAGRSIPAVTLPHPSGISRWLNLPANRDRHDIALRQLGEILGTLPSDPPVPADGMKPSAVAD
ncbi:MAG TPA: uracil-DNA glycosylase family protein [Thermomicrobiales bacterium]|jgi:uracil-DNA glycosylase|nr:uracil-DNA glycosylase family protein [Thermomicrobiales bacterium]